jgi:hypothetical protein
LVVGLDEEIAVCVGEYAGELAGKLVELMPILAIEDNRQGEIAQRLTVSEYA